MIFAKNVVEPTDLLGTSSNASSVERKDMSFATARRIRHVSIVTILFTLNTTVLHG